MSNEKKTIEKNIEYNCENLPFKSSSCFIIPFSIEEGFNTNSIELNGFKEYDVNKNVFYMNPDLKEHLTKGPDCILKVYENNTTEIDDKKSEHLKDIEYCYYCDTGNVTHSESKKADNTVDFFIKTVRLYFFNDKVNFAFFELLIPKENELKNILKLNEYLKNNEAFFNDKIFSYLGENIEILSEEPYLFNYTYCSKEEYEDKNLFYLASGNKSTYEAGDKTEFKKYIQSQNIKQCIVRNGISRIVQNNNYDDNFHYNINNPRGMYNSVRNNYVFVYILALHQYFGLRVMNYKILDKTKESLRIKLTEKSDLYRGFLTIKNQAEQFYLENVIVDVSPILHINRTYNYIRDVFHLDEIINDFYRDLELCKTILDEKISTKLDRLNKSTKFAISMLFVSLILSLLQTLSALFPPPWI